MTEISDVRHGAAAQDLYDPAAKSPHRLPDLGRLNSGDWNA
jgi:hypothetical protein